jgi:hypothetical protein
VRTDFGGLLSKRPIGGEKPLSVTVVMRYVPRVAVPELPEDAADYLSCLADADEAIGHSARNAAAACKGKRS